MFVYSNEESEEMEYRIYSGTKRQLYRHFESIPFEIDAIKGSFEQGYKFSNVAPDNTFFVSAYPNPFETKFKVEIQTEKAQTFTLRLVDIAGHTLMEQNIEEEITETTVQVNTQALELSSGVYFLQVIGSLGETSTIKLVK